MITAIFASDLREQRSDASRSPLSQIFQYLSNNLVSPVHDFTILISETVTIFAASCPLIRVLLLLPLPLRVVVSYMHRRDTRDDPTSNQSASPLLIR